MLNVIVSFRTFFPEKSILDFNPSHKQHKTYINHFGTPLTLPQFVARNIYYREQEISILLQLSTSK